MWICTPFALLMPSLRPANTVPAGDNRLIQVRARRRIDLTRFRDLYMPELGEIIEIPHTDYEVRAYCTHEQLAAAVAKVVMDIDFVKFKPTTERFKDHQLHNAYNAMWGAAFRILSTKKHQREYWGLEAARYRRSSTGRGRITPPTIDWSDIEDDEKLSDLVPKSWDDEVPTVTRMPNGNIDHSFCDHSATKSARRRCRERNRDN